MVNAINKIFIFLFLSIFLISFIYAIQPPQVNLNIDTGMQVEFTEIDFLKNGQAHLFNAHIFNLSSGLRVTNETTDCNFHLFDNVGFHIINQVPMDYDAVGLDFEYNVTGGNFTRNGQYSYLIVCNSTNIGGFVSFDIEVTESGTILKEGEGIVLFGIILILIITIIFLMIATMFIKNLPFQVFLGSLSVLMLVATMGFGVTIMQQLFGIFTNIVSSYTLFFRLFMILLGAAGISLVLFLVVFAMKLFSKSRGRVD